MKHNRHKVGDTVRITATKQFGIQYTNKSGGTSEYPVNKPLVVEIVKAWGDYEIGRRYIGRTKTGKEYYFGEFHVAVERA